MLWAAMQRPFLRRSNRLIEIMLDTYSTTADLIAHCQPEEPVNCLSPAILDEHVAYFREQFPGTVAFAVKANPATPLLERLCDAGITHYDVASVTEIEQLRAVSEGLTLLYDNPVKSRQELDQAYNGFAVRNFAVDDLLELEKLHDVIGNDRDVEISVRFNAGESTAVYDLGRKFGATVEDAALILAAAEKKGYRVALTFHPGSQCTTANAYNQYIASAADIEKAAKVRIEMLNIGGGFPTVYPNSNAPMLSDIFTEVGQQFDRSFANRDLELVCEPGRALVDPAISILTRVKHRRVEPVVFLNDGIYGGFMEQLLSRVEMPTRVFRGTELLEGEQAFFKVFGPTCDSLDVFSYDIALPSNIQEGDWVEFGEMGGYGSSTATHFNGYGTGDYVIVEAGFPRSESGVPT